LKHFLMQKFYSFNEELSQNFDEFDELHSIPFQPEEIISGSFDQEPDDYSEEIEEQFILPTIGPITVDPQKVVHVEDWDSLRTQLQSSDDKILVNTLRLLRKYVETNDSGAKLSKENGILQLLNESLYSYNPNIQIATTRALSAIARNESILTELRQLGTLVRMEYLRNAPNANVAKAVDVAIDNIHNCVKLVGFGPSPSDTDEPNYDRTIVIKQERFKRCGVGHRLWPAAYVMSRWIYDHKEMWKGKKIVEVGCGPALAGLVVAPYCESILLTDYLDVILRMADINAGLNNLPNAKAGYLNWAEVANGTQQNLPEFDLVIASDVIYGVELALLLGKTVAKLLAPKKGTFYGIMQGNRIGIEEFVEELERLGVKTEVTKPDDKYIVGIANRNIWVFITAQAT